MKATRKVIVMIVAIALSVVMSAPVQTASACASCSGPIIILSAKSSIAK